MVAFFACSWLAVLGGSLTFIVASTRMNPALNSRETCLNSGVNSFIATATIIPLINDTLVFLAITWRLFRNSYVSHTLTSGMRILIFGDYLPVFSKVLLKDGQAYYLLALSWSISHACSSHVLSTHRTIVTLNIVSVIMLFYPSNSNVLRTFFATPNVVLMNVMACRVFRNTILFGERDLEAEISTIHFQEI